MNENTQIVFTTNNSNRFPYGNASEYDKLFQNRNRVSKFDSFETVGGIFSEGVHSPFNIFQDNPSIKGFPYFLFGLIFMVYILLTNYQFLLDVETCNYVCNFQNCPICCSSYSSLIL